MAKRITITGNGAAVRGSSKNGRVDVAGLSIFFFNVMAARKAAKQ